MIQITTVIALVLAIPALCFATGEQIPRGVVGGGGGEMSGTNHTLNGTVAQAVIGIVAGPNHIHQIGFWYMPEGIATAVAEGEDGIPKVFHLGPNRPNPFNPVTTLDFAVPRKSRVTIILYDISGRVARDVTDAEYAPGYHSVAIDAGNLASGIYLCRMTADDFARTVRMVLIR